MTALTSIPRVSIVMAAYNVEPYLDDTIRSVVAQTFKDWELVAVDDSSTDRTREMLAQWNRRDSRIRYVTQPRAGRPAPGRNRGVREARGEIIMFLDGDDLYHPNKLALQVSLLDALPEVGGIFHDFIWFRNGSSPDTGEGYLRHLEYLRKAGPVFQTTLINGMVVHLGTSDLFKFMSSELIGLHTSTIAVRREVLNRLGPDPFNEALPHGEDIHLWGRIGRETRLAFVDDTLSYYRYHPTSWVMSTSRARIALGLYLVNSEMLGLLENMLRPDELPRYRPRLATYWYRIGRTCLEGGLRSEARKAFLHALIRTRKPLEAFWSVKSLVVTLLPKWLLHLRWRRTHEGEFSPRPGPPDPPGVPGTAD